MLAERTAENHPNHFFGKMNQMWKFDSDLICNNPEFDIIELRRGKEWSFSFLIVVDERGNFMFRYNVRGENIEVTEAIRDYVEKK